MDTVFSLVSWTEQHLSYPVNYCNMAMTCIHDNRLVCASTPDGCSRRTFLDQCDMYEYNCDYNTKYTTKACGTCVGGRQDFGYHETYFLHCMTSDLEAAVSVTTSVTEITNIPEEITLIEENNIVESTPSFNPVPTTCVSKSSTTKSYGCPCQTIKSSTISPRTSSLTTITDVKSLTKTTRIGPITTNTIPSTTTSTIPMTTTTSAVSTTTVSKTPTKTSTGSAAATTTTTASTNATTFFSPNNVEVIATTSSSKMASPSIQPTTSKIATTIRKPKTIQEFIGCCERLKTWETTIEDFKTVIMSDVEDDPLYKDNYETNSAVTIESTTKPSSLTVPTISRQFSTTLSTIKVTFVESTTHSITKSMTQVLPPTVSTSNNTFNTTEIPIKTLPPVISTRSVPDTTTPKTSRELTRCCERPKSWETTKENIKVYTFDSTSKLVSFIVPNTSLSTVKKSTVKSLPLASTTSPISINKITTETLPLVVSITSSLPSTIQSKAKSKPPVVPTINNSLPSTIVITTNPVKFVPNSTVIKNVTSTILQNTSTVPTTITTICIHCERPKTWETTTEKKLPDGFMPTSNKMTKITSEKTTAPTKTTAHIETTIDKEITNLETTTVETTITAEPEVITAAKEITTTTEKNRLYDIDTTDSNNQLLISTDDSSDTNTDVITMPSKTDVDLIKSKTPTKETPQTTWWYSSSCKFRNCERPATWLTTKQRRRHRKY